MALSLQGWMNGISVMGVIISFCVFGLFFIYKSKQSNAKLLYYMGFATIFTGLTWFGGFVDFLAILLTGKNMDNSNGLNGTICLIWGPPAWVIAIYIGNELLIPEKKELKRGIVFTYLILGIIFEILIFLDPMGSFVFLYPSKQGEDLIDPYLVFNSPAGIIYIINMLSIAIQWGIGFFIKGLKSSGVIRKKFFILSLGIILLIIFIISDGILNFANIITRIGAISCSWIFYYGLREEPEKKEEFKPKKEVRVEGDLFRISKRPDQITEEEVTYFREHQICLVCRGEIFGFNNFICRCKAIYCEKCARALIELENMCWACDAPIDESKPVKPFKKEEAVDIEISEKIDKKSSNK